MGYAECAFDDTRFVISVSDVTVDFLSGDCTIVHGVFAEVIMELVVDTSALLAVIVGESERDRIIEMAAGCSLIGPASIPWEVGNAFSAMLKKKMIEIDTALKGMAVFEGIRIRYVNTDFTRVLRISAENKIYAYDAYVLECALQRNAPILTLDRRLRNTAASIGIVVWEI